MTGWIVLAVILVPFAVLWVGTLVEVVRRDDASIRSTIVWIALLVLVPVVGVAGYVVLRRPPRRAVAAAPGELGRAERFVEAAERRQRGELDDEAFASEAARLLTEAPAD